MKSIYFIVAVMVTVIIGSNSIAQNQKQQTTIKNVTFKVWGNCDLCKTRIEKAANINGVSKADWNTDTKILTLVYNPSLVTSDAVQKKIAAVGHDTEKYRADDAAYAKLPSCCQYKREK